MNYLGFLIIPVCIAKKRDNLLRMVYTVNHNEEGRSPGLFPFFERSMEA